ncbi:hypothetical protein FB451DRAFT_1192296 [Mycena latifolia]|nr:hypothetical protein FB451DRAFT_1192296 [Mycena latifolia]
MFAIAPLNNIGPPMPSNASTEHARSVRRSAAPVSRMPPQPPRSRTLTRADRALCRALRAHPTGKFTVSVITARTGWSEKVIRRAAHNQYIPPDDLSADAGVLAASATHANIIDEMVRQRDQERNSRQQESGGRRAPRQKTFPQPEQTARSPPVVSSSSSAAASAPAPNRPRRAPKASPGSSFLEKFVKGSALDPKYLALFEAANVTEDDLRRMAPLDEVFMQDYLGGLVPESSKSDRMKFAIAVRRLG